MIRDIRYPNFASYNCYEGFSVDNGPNSAKAFTVQCGVTGSFNQEPEHMCTAIKCGAAPPMKHTAQIAGVFFYTDQVTYKCLRGYTIDGVASGQDDFSVSCQASGTFTSTQQCQAIRCGPPPDFTNTKVHKGGRDDKYYGDESIFACRPGYALDQKFGGPTKFTLVCGASGEFKVKGFKDGEVKFPKCGPVSAGMSPRIDHGNLASKEMFYRQEAWVSADTGYSYEEVPNSGLSFKLSVTTEGKYSNVKEFKPVSCGAPPSVKNSKTKFNKKKAVFGDELAYDCTAGYSTDSTPAKASLSFAVACESDADFSAVPGLGECVNIDDCAQHNCGPFGTCVDQLLNYTCKCDRGYEQIKDEESGEKVCGNIDDCGPEACGLGRCEDLVEDYICHCPTGYEQVNTGDEKTCQAKICGIPPSVTNAGTSPVELAGTKASFKEEVAYQCDEGYTTDSKPGGKNRFSIECKANEQFTDTKSCKPVKCEAAATVEHGTPSPASTTFQKDVKYKCDLGYTIDGTAKGDTHFTVSCQKNGKYTDTQECLPVSCGEPDEAGNAFRESGQVYFPSKRTYSCFKGFSLDGMAASAKEFDIKCQDNGKLTKMKQCLAIVCGEPPKHINALFATAADEGPVAYPSVTEVTCRDGYTVGGDAKDSNVFGVKCLATGKFESYDKRECMPVRCGAVPKFNNSELKKAPKGNSLNFEETATYKCQPGFTAGGEPDASTQMVAECLANGELSYPAEDMQCRNVNACEQHTCGPRGTCIDTVGTSIVAYSCKCEDGFAVTMVKGEKFCGNIDDCGDHQCGPGVCKDLIGDYTCVCPRGHYIGVDNGEKTCLPVRCEAETPKLDNGKQLTKHTGGIFFPLSLRFSCNEGYSTDGSVGDAKKAFHANCKAAGTFDGMMSCQKVSCGTPRVLTNAKIDSPGIRQTVDYNEIVSYSCKTGYTIGATAAGKKSFTTKCLASGVLSDPEVCDAVSCGNAPSVKNGRAALSGNVYFGNTLQYLCDAGHSLDGTATGKTKFPVDCLKTGKFSDTTTECKPLSAGELSDIPNMKLTEYNGKAADM